MLYDKTLAKSRAQLTNKIRDFFNNNGFLEVETSIMTPIPGMEPHLTPFETKFVDSQSNTQTLYLNTSPELQMKKLLGAGFGNIYNLTKVFRNGEVGGGRHNPEFTMLEWYRINADYKNLMEDCENLVIALAKTLNTANILTFDNHKVDISKPWTKSSIKELFQEYCRIDLEQNKDFETFAKTATQHRYDIEACQDWDEIFYKIFLNEIEPKIGFDKPIFVYDYPASQAALSKKKQENPFWAERFELYIAGNEIANAYSELIDSKEQRTRLEEEQNLRRKLNKPIFHIDEEFLTSLESITTPSAGIALGVDRLFMVLLDKKTIEEVLLFPLGKMTGN
ncbi:MAG: EF-P lysine aminoacylase EpmA [Candidatus Gracilibacteria bacterium]|jgi:lysyl-tRNA synthetase class 2